MLDVTLDEPDRLSGLEASEAVVLRTACRAPPPRAAPRDAEVQLAALARAPAALRRALARVAGRLVATRAWERLGFARLDDYAAERAGLSARELRDLAAVDAALAGLPRLEAAFLARQIGWTQLRLLCRVATPEDEAAWLTAASRLTAGELAREVRAVDRRARAAGVPGSAAGSEADGARVGVVLRVSRHGRARWWRARQVASRMAGHALAPGAVAEAVAAEVLSAIPLDGAVPGTVPAVPRARGAGAHEVPRPTPGPEGPGPAQALPPPAVDPTALQARPVDPAVDPGADAEPAFLAALERNLDTADAFALDARLRRAVRLESQGLASVASALAHVVALGLHRDLGFRSVDAYCEQRLAMAPSRGRALLRIARAGVACPALQRSFARGTLSWVQAHALVPLLLDPAAARHRAAWIEHATRVSVRRLRDDVEHSLAAGAFAVPPLSPVPAPTPDPDQDDPAGLQTGANTRLRCHAARLFFSADPEVAHLFRAALVTVQRRLERIRGRPSSAPEALEAMLDHALAVWEGSRGPGRLPREHRVFERDGWRCTAPGCSSYRNLHAHHVVFRSAGGSDEPHNLTTLCAWHHLRGVHAGRVGCSGTAPGGLRFALGVRPGRAPLALFGPGEVSLLRSA